MFFIIFFFLGVPLSEHAWSVSELNG
uniref:Uncharacterized protein n=1 Tax=Anguilla anguilla TaxID=7936 RepID=A0A0E9XFX7_ANGAN